MQQLNDLEVLATTATSLVAQRLKPANKRPKTQRHETHHFKLKKVPRVQQLEDENLQLRRANEQLRTSLLAHVSALSAERAISRAWRDQANSATLRCKKWQFYLLQMEPYFRNLQQQRHQELGMTRILPQTAGQQDTAN